MFVKTVVNEPRSAHDIIWSTQSEKPYKKLNYIYCVSKLHQRTYCTFLIQFMYV